MTVSHQTGGDHYNSLHQRAAVIDKEMVLNRLLRQKARVTLDYWLQGWGLLRFRSSLAFQMGIQDMTPKSFSTFSEKENKFLLMFSTIRKYTLMNFPTVYMVRLHVYDEVESKPLWIRSGLWVIWVYVCSIYQAKLSYVVYSSTLHAFMQ